MPDADAEFAISSCPHRSTIQWTEAVPSNAIWSAPGRDISQFGLRNTMRHLRFGTLAALAGLLSTAPVGAQETRPSSREAASTQVPVVVLQARPDRVQVPNDEIRTAIDATGLPWRIATCRDLIEFVLIPRLSFTLPFSAHNSSRLQLFGPPQTQFRDVIVDIDRPFYISRTEVSLSTAKRIRPKLVERQEKRFASLTEGDAKLRTHLLHDDNCPLVGVTLKEAWAFATDIGCRLPTEMEWAAVFHHGSRAAQSRTGEVPPPAGNALDQRFADRLTWTTYPGECLDDGHVGLSRCASFPCDSLGVFDMHGNASEWASPRIPRSAFEIRIADAANEAPIGRISSGALGVDFMKTSGRSCGSNWVSDIRFFVISIADREAFSGSKSRPNMYKYTEGMRLVLESDRIVIGN